jgi:DNA-binding SARP family transcriptional activator
MYYGDAIALYRNTYMEDSYGEWCEKQRAELQQDYLMALEWLSNYDSRHGNTEAAIVHLQKLIECDSYREDVYCAMMRLQIQLGNRTGALKTYQRCSQMLQEEMGIAPGAETQALYDQIVNIPKSNDQK